MKYLVVILLSFNLTACKLADRFAEKQVYASHIANKNYPMKDDTPPVGFQSLWFGDVLTWAKYSDKPVTILYLGGNAENLRSLNDTNTLKVLSTYGNIVVLDYPSYGVSKGHPSEAVIVNKVVEVIEFLYKIDQPVILWGRSLGAAIALQAASQTDKLCGLILVSPFSDLKTQIREISKLGRYVSKEFYLKNSYHYLDATPHIEVPTLLIHGNKDTFINVHHSIDIHKAIKHSELKLVNNSNHNDIYRYKETWDTITTFITGRLQ